MYNLNDLPEFLKCWVSKGTKDNTQLELYISLPIADDTFMGFILIIIGFFFGAGMGFGGLAGLLKQFNWVDAIIGSVGLLFVGLFFVGLRMFIRSIYIWILKKENKAGIWILKTGILIREEPSKIKYFKWEQLEEAVIEHGYVTQTGSASRYYSSKMIRFDFKTNENHRFRFKGDRGHQSVDPKNDLINLLAYDVTENNGSLKKVINACEKFITIHKLN